MPKFASFVFLFAGGIAAPCAFAQPGFASPDAQQLQQQVIELSSQLDRTSYLITAVLLLFMALACVALWWNARTFPAFRSVGLYLASVSCVFFADYLHKSPSWRSPSWHSAVFIWHSAVFILTTLLWPEMAADVLNIPKGWWIWLNRVPCTAALLLAWTPLLQSMSRITFDFSELMVAVLLFIGFRRGNSSNRLVRAALTLLWFTRVSLDPLVRRFVPTQFNLWGWHWNFGPLVMVLFGAIAFALFVRELISDRQEKQRLAAELEAGRAMQQALLGEEMPIVPGLRIESVYKPAGEVGGDFFQVLPAPGGGVLVAVGDVSGKGLRAAMTASAILGALRVLPASSPAKLLRALNSSLAERLKGGFVTCLIAQIELNGVLTLANAGHLAPYRNGEEIQLESGLPLGIAPDASYTESNIQLAPDDRLTFLSDGVVEAQSASGELFGFDRARSISTRSAEEIARAAQTHGQQDDITVLTLTFAPVEVLHV